MSLFYIVPIFRQKYTGFEDIICLRTEGEREYGDLRRCVAGGELVGGFFAVAGGSPFFGDRRASLAVDRRGTARRRVQFQLVFAADGGVAVAAAQISGGRADDFDGIRMARPTAVFEGAVFAVRIIRGTVRPVLRIVLFCCAARFGRLQRRGILRGFSVVVAWLDGALLRDTVVA